jgi:acyl-coenzyme A thioesterase PaaI-like protein
MRNTDHGRIIAESKLTHGGRMMLVCDSTVRDEDGRLLATVTTTHLIPARR